jgi:hypothetical protein
MDFYGSYAFRRNARFLEKPSSKLDMQLAVFGIKLVCTTTLEGLMVRSRSDAFVLGFAATFFIVRPLRQSAGDNSAYDSISLRFALCSYPNILHSPMD